MTDKEIELALETIALVLEDLKKTQEKHKELLASPQRTEQLKACVYCGQLVVKEKIT